MNNLEIDMPRALAGHGFGKLAVDVDRILRQMQRVKRISYAELLRRNLFYADDATMDNIIRHLERIGAVRRENVDGKSWLVYVPELSPIEAPPDPDYERM